MKPLFIFLLSLTFSVSHAGTGNDDTITSGVKQSFEKSFSGAQDISWTETSDYYKAQFLLHGQHATAFFNKEGNLLGIVRNIAVTQLPVLLQANLKELAKDTWISELFELSNHDGITYYITLENAEGQTTLRSSSTEWSTYQKKSKL